MHWWTDPVSVIGGLAMVAAFVGAVMLMIFLMNKSGQKFKDENPDAATIWITSPPENYYGVRITKVDNKWPKRFEPRGSRSVNTFILPGAHVLSLEHINLNPAVNKTREFKRGRRSELKVFLEAGQDYCLLFNQLPGRYSLVAGKPNES